MKILITGGAGYIGSHFVKLLIENHVELFIIDNLSRGHQESIPKNVIFEKADINDNQKLNSIFKKYKPDSVVHFAALAYVGESVENPTKYYQNNVVGSFNLIKACSENEVENFIFSSTCSIYGNPRKIPIAENEPSNPINPYANTKFIIETILKDFESKYGMKSVSLRYFNAAGASFDGSIGESHNPETHLIPLVMETALGKRKDIWVFGNDYNTKDGTCIRDYIHVEDLAEAHFKALRYLQIGNESTIINLGTGNGNSVLEIIEMAKRISKKKIDYVIANRRQGDPAILVASNEKAKKLLSWEPKYSIDDILTTAWNWHSNPKF
ncbi:MAG: UDP-glucose 4-epimerase GalE [Ignavibacteria bacterium]|nr:UDP-glucose 4-epimerase GalE [Ignavibacteria bacterium]